MYLGKMLKIWHTLAFRLTLWYALIFTVSSLCAFLLFYLSISSVLQQRMDKELLNEISEFSSILKQKGEDSIEALIQAEAESEGIGQSFFRCLDRNGEIIASSNMSSWEGVDIDIRALTAIINGQEHVFETTSFPGRQNKVRLLYGSIGPDRIMQIGQSLEDDARFLETFKQIFGISVILFTVFSAFIGWFMARHALSPFQEVTRTAQDISNGAFERRVQITAKSDEIVQLTSAFNKMLNHIHGLMAGMREVTDNIAHDLKTPITRIRALAESELIAGKTSEDLAVETVEECDYLLQMINTMLEISEAEAGLAPSAKEEVDMAGVVQNACELFRPIAKDKSVTLISRIPSSVPISGNIHGLQRMVVNILENAIKYTPTKGTVTISLDDLNGQIVITFHDTGIGISEEDLPHIFRRLYRCEPSRSQPGFGLGLSLALAIARAHGGNITVTSVLGKGSTFKVILPR